MLPPVGKYSLYALIRYNQRSFANGGRSRRLEPAFSGRPHRTGSTGGRDRETRPIAAETTVATTGIARGAVVSAPASSEAPSRMALRGSVADVAVERRKTVYHSTFRANFTIRWNIMEYVRTYNTIVLKQYSRDALNESAG